MWLSFFFTISADVDVLEVPVSASCVTQLLFSLYLDPTVWKIGS